jgi:hypothetical protein
MREIRSYGSGEGPGEGNRPAYSTTPFSFPRRRCLAGDLGRRAACRSPVRRCWAPGAGRRAPFPASITIWGGCSTNRTRVWRCPWAPGKSRRIASRPGSMTNSLCREKRAPAPWRPAWCHDARPAVAERGAGATAHPRGRMASCSSGPPLARRVRPADPRRTLPGSCIEKQCASVLFYVIQSKILPFGITILPLSERGQARGMYGLERVGSSL